MANLFSVKDKNILITGSTSGIGLAGAAHLAEEGARVVICGRRSEGRDLAVRIGATFIKADVSKPKEVESLIRKSAEHLGGTLDALFLNAGVGNLNKMIDELSVEEMRQLFSVNFDHIYAGTHYAVPYMAENSSIVFTSSPAATVTGATFAAYSAAKSAVSMLARTAAIELAPRKIRVNCLVPGVVVTGMLNPNTDDWPLVSKMVSGTPRKPEEIAPMFQLLASDASAPMTGGELRCDDGLTAGISLNVMGAVVSSIDAQVAAAGSTS